MNARSHDFILLYLTAFNVFLCGFDLGEIAGKKDSGENRSWKIRQGERMLLAFVFKNRLCIWEFILNLK